MFNLHTVSTGYCVVAKFITGDLITKAEQNERKAVDKVQKEKPSYPFKFKLKVIKEINDPHTSAKPYWSTLKAIYNDIPFFLFNQHISRFKGKPHHFVAFFPIQ